MSFDLCRSRTWSRRRVRLRDRGLHAVPAGWTPSQAADPRPRRLGLVKGADTVIAVGSGGGDGRPPHARGLRTPTPRARRIASLCTGARSCSPRGRYCSTAATPQPTGG
ncbi:hypothetical protein [Nonomuraea dietziae]|uniref:hypothetical protein n=1 Tax=Nonomuraea dietziae TaxID=65515 RepID=UPI0031D6923C